MSNAASKTAGLRFPAGNQLTRLAPGLICLLTAVLYSGTLDNSLHGDDYRLFAEAGTGLSWTELDKPIIEHFVPVLRAFYLAQYRLFGMDVRPMYTVLWLLHISAVWLCYRTISLFTSDRRLGLLTALLFGVSTAHASVPMHLATSGQVLTTNCFLLSMLFFLKHLNKKQASSYGPSILFHFLMPFCFTGGFSVPFIFFTCVLVKEASLSSKTLRRGLLLSLPYIANILVYAALRAVFFESDRVIPTQFAASLTRLPDTLAVMLWGAAYNYGVSYTAALLFEPFSQFWLKAAVVCGALLYGAAAYRARDQFAGRRAAALFFFSAAFLFYLLPAFGRSSEGMLWFAHRDRYAYLPGPMVAGLVALVFVSCWDSFQRFGRTLCLAALFVVVGTNIYFVWRKEQVQGLKLQKFAPHREAYLQDLRELPQGKGRAVILNDIFTDRITHRTAWSATPERICLAYQGAEFCRRFRFIKPEEFAELDSGRLYRVERGTGRLQPVHDASTAVRKN